MLQQFILNTSSHSNLGTPKLASKLNDYFINNEQGEFYRFFQENKLSIGIASDRYISVKVNEIEDDADGKFLTPDFIVKLDKAIKEVVKTHNGDTDYDIFIGGYLAQFL